MKHGFLKTLNIEMIGMKVLHNMSRKASVCWPCMMDGHSAQECSSKASPSTPCGCDCSIQRSKK